MQAVPLRGSLAACPPSTDSLAASSILHYNTTVLRVIMYNNSTVDNGYIALPLATKPYINGSNHVRRDSGNYVYKADDELDAKPHLEMLHADPVVAYDGTSISADLDSHCNSAFIKRAASEADGDDTDSIKPKKTARKARSSSNSKGNDAVGEGVRRVGCPFFKKDPRHYGQKMSCRGIGFSEMAKVKYDQIRPTAWSFR